MIPSSALKFSGLEKFVVKEENIHMWKNCRVPLRHTCAQFQWNIKHSDPCQLKLTRDCGTLQCSPGQHTYCPYWFQQGTCMLGSGHQRCMSPMPENKDHWWRWSFTRYNAHSTQGKWPHTEQWDPGKHSVDIQPDDKHTPQDDMDYSSNESSYVSKGKVR